MNVSVIARAYAAGHAPATADAAAPRDTEILIFLPQLGSGGVERVACLLANGFHHANARVRLVTIDRKGPASRIIEAGVPLTHLGLPTFLTKAPRAVKQAAALAALVGEIRHRRPALLVSPGNHAHLAVAFAHWIADAPGVQLVLKMTNPIDRPGRGGLERWMMQRLYAWLFRRAAKVLTLSEGGAERLRRLSGGERSQFAFVHNPYVPATTEPATRSPAEEPVILAVGRLSKQKNLALLLSAAARIVDRPWRLVVVGCGPQAEDLAALARELGIESRVDFVGFVQDPTPYYRSAHVLALPSQWEDLPAVAVEALAIGCPVIATDCSPALSELIRDVGNGKVVSSDVEAFAEGLSHALDQPFSYAADQRLDRFSIERGIADHLRILRSVRSDTQVAPVADEILSPAPTVG